MEDMTEIYWGEMADRDGNVWRVSIQQRGATKEESAGELHFAGREPLVIEWEETGPEEPICSSLATLTIISPGDMTYAGLYTIAVGEIGMEVHRNRQLYWQGTLDAEEYEEPWVTTSDYEVTLTFSDFATLKRLKYNGEGVKSLNEIVNESLTRIGITEPVKMQTVSTEITAGSLLSGDELGCVSENFYDEDGEGMTLEEVMQGVMQPLALKMIQHKGKIIIYDINAMATMDEGKTAGKVNVETVEWMGTDAVMGTGRVYNSINVRYSPYAAAKLCDESWYWTGREEYSDDVFIPKGERGPDIASLRNMLDRNENIAGGSEEYDFVKMDDVKYLVGGAKVTLTAQRPATEDEDYNRRVFAASGQIHLSGTATSNDEAVLVMTAHHDTDGYDTKHGTYYWIDGQNSPDMLMQGGGAVVRYANRPEIMYVEGYGSWGSLTAGERAGYRLMVTMDMIVDPRRSYTQEDGTEYATWTKAVWAMTLPVRVLLYGDDGETMQLNSDGSWTTYNWMTHNTWTSGKMSWKHGGSLPGWKSNEKGCIGAGYNYMVTSGDHGLAIPLPPKNGKVRVSICYDLILTNEKGTEQGAMYDRVKWWMMKSPELTLRRTDSDCSTADSDDIEYDGIVNENAADELTIETICGTSETPSPLDRGCYRLMRDNSLIRSMSRAGKTSQAEELLIRTVISQYGNRRVKLSGTIKAPADMEEPVMTERLMGKKRFGVTAMVEDIEAGTSEITMVEIKGDTWGRR